MSEEETRRYALQESHEGLQTILAAADSIDTKIAWIFGIASVFIILVRSFDAEPITGLAERLMWAIAGIAWFIAVLSCFIAALPREFPAGTDPAALLRKGWLQKVPEEYVSERIKYLGRSYAHASKTQRTKGRLLRYAMLWTLIEVIALLLVAFLRIAG